MKKSSICCSGVWVVKNYLHTLRSEFAIFIDTLSINIHIINMGFWGFGDEKVIDLLFWGLGGQKLLAHVEE